MRDRVLVTPTPEATVRLHAVYRSAAALLRELSRALSQGHTVLKAETGLPVGTRLVLALSTPALKAPVEVQGTVTDLRQRGRRLDMSLRYDFDAGAHRQRLREAMAELRRGTRRPRREPRVPLALRTPPAALLRGLTATVSDASRAGARLELVGESLPKVAEGDRVQMTLAGSRPGTRRAGRLVLEALWVGPVHREGRRRRQEIGGRFVRLSPALRERIGALLSFDDARPTLRLTRVVPRRR